MKYKDDWHKAYCDCKDELEQLKHKLRKEFTRFDVLCGECHGTSQVYRTRIPGEPGDYVRCPKCKGSGINKKLSFDLKDKVVIEVTRDEADWIWRDMDGLSGACENEELNKVYKNVTGQIREQLERK